MVSFGIRSENVVYGVSLIFQRYLPKSLSLCAARGCRKVVRMEETVTEYPIRCHPEIGTTVNSLSSRQCYQKRHRPRYHRNRLCPNLDVCISSISSQFENPATKNTQITFLRAKTSMTQAAKQTFDTCVIENAFKIFHSSFWSSAAIGHWLSAIGQTSIRKCSRVLKQTGWKCTKLCDSRSPPRANGNWSSFTWETHWNRRMNYANGNLAFLEFKRM